MKISFCSKEKIKSPAVWPTYIYGQGITISKAILPTLALASKHTYPHKRAFLHFHFILREACIHQNWWIFAPFPEIISHFFFRNPWQKFHTIPYNTHGQKWYSSQESFKLRLRLKLRHVQKSNISLPAVIGSAPGWKCLTNPASLILMCQR